MDQERLERLFYGQEFMDIALLSRLQAFRNFTERSIPFVTALCSENRLRMNMDKLLIDDDEIYYSVCETVNDPETAFEKALFSDIVIVNTRALQIAPQGLHSVLKALSEVDKEIYIILSGWESIPRNAELRNQKTAQVDLDFSFSKITLCRCAFSKPEEGFTPIENILAECRTRCISNFPQVHSAQEEALFRWLLRDVRKFRSQIHTEMMNEMHLVIKMQDILQAKQKRYEFVYGDATITLSDVIERFEKSVDSLRTEDILYQIQEESQLSADTLFRESKTDAEQLAKKLAGEWFSEKIQTYLEKGGASISSQADNRIQLTVQDLHDFTAKLKVCHYIDPDVQEQLANHIKQTDKLLQNASFISDVLYQTFQNAIPMLISRITAFQFEYDKSHIFKRIVKTAAESLDSSKQTDPSDGIQSNNIQGKTLFENSRAILTQWNEQTELNEYQIFCDEVNRMIIYAKNTISEILHTQIKQASGEVEVHSLNIVQEYFSIIDTELSEIEKDLKEKMEPYGRSEI